MQIFTFTAANFLECSDQTRQLRNEQPDTLRLESWVDTELYKVCSTLNPQEIHELDSLFDILSIVNDLAGIQAKPKKCLHNLFI